MRNKKYLFASLITISLLVCSLVYGQEESEPVFSGRLLVKFQSDFPDWYPELIAMASRKCPSKTRLLRWELWTWKRLCRGYTETACMDAGASARRGIRRTRCLLQTTDFYPERPFESDQ